VIGFGVTKQEPTNKVGEDGNSQEMAERISKVIGNKDLAVKYGKKEDGINYKTINKIK
jgi:hypothetical protein